MGGKLSISALPSQVPPGCATCIPWTPQLRHGCQVPPPELVHGVTAFGQCATVGCEQRLKDGFVCHVILRWRGSHGQGLSHAERNGIVLSSREPRGYCTESGANKRAQAEKRFPAGRQKSATQGGIQADRATS